MSTDEPWLQRPDPDSPVAASEQLRAHVAGRAASGELPAGTRLPTVRGLAEQLGLAAGTVAKAYRALEADGVVVTEGRRGTFVASGSAARSGAATDAAAANASTSRRLGLTLPEAVQLLHDHWTR